jgi:predicted O-methyltransferase YrrM
LTLALGGTAAHERAGDLPPLVERAVALARRRSFEHSCLPEQGRLLRLLAAGAGAGTIGETGTGCGVGLAWLASGASAGCRLFSVELDPALARAAAEVFADDPRVLLVNLGRAVDLRDRTVAFDGMHLTPAANDVIAAALVEPVLAAMSAPDPVQ